MLTRYTGKSTTNYFKSVSNHKYVLNFILRWWLYHTINYGKLKILLQRIRHIGRHTWSNFRTLALASRCLHHGKRSWYSLSDSVYGAEFLVKLGWEFILLVLISGGPARARISGLMLKLIFWGWFIMQVTCLILRRTTGWFTAAHSQLVHTCPQ